MGTEQDLLLENQELRHQLRQLEKLLTKTNKAEECLKSERHFSSALLDTMDALVVVLDQKGRILRFNRACEESTRYSFAEVKNKPFWDIFKMPEEINEVKAIFRELCLGPWPKTHESNLINREGHLRRIAWSNTALFTDGQVQSVIWTGIDITEREQADKYIAHLATFPQINPNPVLEIDLSGRITFYNVASLNTLEGLGLPWHLEAFLPQDLAEIRKQATETGNDQFQREVKIGNSVFEERISFPSGLDTVRIYAWDITDRMQAEEALRESEERFRAFMDNSPAIAWAKDEAGRYIYLSKAYEKRIGVRLADWRGKTDFELWPKKIAQEFRKNDLAVLENSLAIEIIEQTRGPDGRPCYWRIFKFPFSDAAGVRFVGGIGIEITASRLAQEALKKSQQELRLLTNKLLVIQENERQRVARELHDELGQALTLLKIKLVAFEDQLTLDKHPLKSDCGQMLSYIDTVIENVRRLFWDLSPSIVKDLGLTHALRYLLEETCRIHDLQSAVKMDEIDHLFSPDVQINIYRIFQESLTNVVKHAGASQVSAKISKERGKVSFLIRDDGRGFNIKQAMSIKSAKRSLGLTTINERVLMAQGSLQITSRRGRGTNITFVIPTINRAAIDLAIGAIKEKPRSPANATD